MLNLMRVFFIYFTSILFIIPQVFGCSTFCLGHSNTLLYGGNYDWMVEKGVLIVNKSGLQKTAMGSLQADSGPYAKWKSKYGSITFNQFGREFPVGGMNEAGLIVHMMELRATKFPEPDKRLAIQALQWIQFQLDNFSNIADVIKSEEYLRIVQGKSYGIHFLVMDKSGKCAAIEWIFGKQYVYTDDSLPIKALTNSLYESSIKNLTKYKAFGGTEPRHESSNSLDRFARIAETLKHEYGNSSKSTIDFAFKVLKSASQNSTLWRIVYDIKKMKIYFSTKTNQNIRWIDLSNLDFSCKNPTLMVELNTVSAGDVSKHLVSYSREDNFNIIKEVFNSSYFLSGIPLDYLTERASYPDTATCIE
jgi:penicillin V acylase-like amidase (Ntn superfamily)